MTDHIGRYLVAYQDGTFRARSGTSTIQSQFQILPVKDKVAFRNVLGKYLAAEEDGSLNWNRDVTSSWELYTMEKKDDKVAFKTFHDDYISVTDDGSIIRTALDEKSMFKIVYMCKRGKNM